MNYHGGNIYSVLKPNTILKQTIMLIFVFESDMHLLVTNPTFTRHISIMNLFGVLKYKKMGEDFVINSGFPYTIIRFVDRILISFNYIINSSK